MKKEAVLLLFAVFICFVPAAAYSGVQLGMEVNPNPAMPGEIMNVALTVTNDGGTPTGEMTLELVYPEHLNKLSKSYVTVGGSSNTLTGVNSVGNFTTGATLVWTLSSLRPGGGVTVTLPPTVSSSAVDGTLIQFDAAVKVGGIQAAHASETAEVASDPLFALAVDEGADPVGTTDLLEYTLTYGNISGKSSGTQLVFPLPSGTSFVSATGDYTESSGEIIWSLGSLASGLGGERRVTVQVNAQEGNILKVDGASITGTDQNYISHTVLADRVTRVEDDEVPLLGIEVNPNPVKLGGQIMAELTVTNPSDTLMSNVKLILRYPRRLNALSKSYITTGGASNSLTGANSVGNFSTNLLMYWNLGNLRPGGGVTVIMPPYVSSTALEGGLIRFEAEIRVDGIQQVMESRTIRVISDPFFTLAVDEGADPVGTADLLEYTLTYGNISKTSSDTKLVFPLPSGTSFVSATDGGTEAEGEVVWDLGSLASGAGGERRVTVQVNAQEGDLLEVDGAYITGIDSSSSTSYKLQADRITRVEDDEVPLFGIEVNPNPVKPGGQIIAEMTVTNLGDALLSNVELILRYPRRLSALSKSYITTGGASNSLTGANSVGNFSTNLLMTWNLGNLRPGGGVTVIMPPYVSSTATEGSLIRFEAEIRVDGIQQTMESRTTRITSDPFFTLNVDEGADPVGTTDILEYTITYGNISNSSSDTQLVFPLPFGTSFVSATGGGNESEGEVVWNIGSLASEEGGERRVTVKVNAEEGNLLEVDGAYIIGTDDSSYMSHKLLFDRVTRVEDDEVPVLAMEFDPIPAEPGRQLEASLTVTNSGDSSLSNVQLILRYPRRLNALSKSLITTDGESTTLTGSNSVGKFSTDYLMYWNFGTLPSGDQVTITMPPTVYSGTPEGVQTQFDAEVRVDGVQQLSLSRSVFVGDVFTNPPYPVVIKGDVDGNGVVNIGDTISALQIVVGLQPSASINMNADVNNDDKIGIPEAVFSLQTAAGLRD